MSDVSSIPLNKGTGQKKLSEVCRVNWDSLGEWNHNQRIRTLESGRTEFESWLCNLLAKWYRFSLSHSSFILKWE